MKFFSIILSSFKMAVEEFRSNKLRTFLSLFGVTIGIFCIISVLTTIDNLEQNIQNDIKSLGSKTVYIDKWEYKGGPDFPWWKYINRPTPASSEIELIRQKVPAAQHICFVVEARDKIEFEDAVLNNVTYYGVSPEYFDIHTIEISMGRSLQPRDFDHATNVVLMGTTVATELFGKPENALDKTVQLKNGQMAVVTGIIRKQGKSVLEMWQYDDCILMPNNVLTKMVPEKYAQPKIIVQGYPEQPLELLLDELEGAMRSLRKLKPAQENNFSLNDIDSFSKMVSDMSSYINKGGWAIAALSLIVGMFGVANIMFVTVRERTSQIGLKKALGAKRSTILMEFLLESAFLCILGGLMGLLLVFILTVVASAMIGIPLFISPDIVGLAIAICIVVGIVAGIIPASIASRMNPVVAIRST